MPLVLHNLTNYKSFLNKDSAYVALTDTNTSSNCTFNTEWDLINQIQYECNCIHIDLQPTHIPSHQDDYTKYATLALHAQLNMDADCLAGEHRLWPHTLHVTSFLLPPTKVHLHIKGTTIITNHQHCMISAYQQRTSLIYLSKEYNWTPDQLSNIHWAAQLRTMKKFLYSPTICKFSNGILPLNHLIH